MFCGWSFRIILGCKCIGETGGRKQGFVNVTRSSSRSVVAALLAAELLKRFLLWGSRNVERNYSKY